MEAKRVQTTRLAEGLDQTGILGEGPMLRSLEAIASFAAQAKARGLKTYAYATSAVRDSANRAVFCGRVEALGLEVEVLSGEEEGRLACLGATGGRGGIIDIGGGSTQIIRPDFAHSAPIGCVRAKELCGAGYSLAEMQHAVFDRCRALLRFPPEEGGEYTGLGGTILTLAALLLGEGVYDPAKVCRVAISRPALYAQMEWLYSLGEAGRRDQSLLRGRTETILPGALILAFVLEELGVERLAVSDRDGMEGYLIKRLGQLGNRTQAQG